MLYRIFLENSHWLFFNFDVCQRQSPLHDCLNSTNHCDGPFKFPKLNLGFFYSCIILPKLNLGFFLQLFKLNQLLSAVLPINSITTVSRWESSLLAGPDVRFRHYLNHLFQTHKLYLILLKKSSD